MTIITTSLSVGDVPLGNGPPTKEELLAHYPAKFTWAQLKTFINSGDLGLLKRDKKLQARYRECNKVIKAKFGSVASYLLNCRVQWGKPDTLSLLSPDYEPNTKFHDSLNGTISPVKGLPPLPPSAPKYFTADIAPEYISIILNDWPYSVPPEIQHSLIWSRVPFFQTDVMPESVCKRVESYGSWGFTGNSEPPPSPSTLPSCIDALSEWHITLDKLKIPPKCTPEEEFLFEEAGKEINTFVKKNWPEDEWETAWFVNPPRLQSIPELSHIHVFARRKSS
ncbi:hypothetical protein AX15_003167 [Amanita polypyramis BW_CC]|nr:hypothetical protein AX15_003167 [Amanita polypyramis BW_CC]